MARREVFHTIVGKDGQEQNFSFLTVDSLLNLGIIKEFQRVELPQLTNEVVIEARFYKKA